MSGSNVKQSLDDGPTEPIVQRPAEDTHTVVDYVQLQEDPARPESHFSSQYSYQNSRAIYDDSFIVDTRTLTDSDVIFHESVSTNRGRDARPLMKRSNEVLQQNDTSDRHDRDLDRYRGGTQKDNQTQSVDNTESIDVARRLYNTQIHSDTASYSQRLENNLNDVKRRDCEVVERQSPKGDMISEYELKINEMMTERAALVTRLHQFVCSNADLHEEMEMMRVELDSARLSSKFHEEREAQLGQELARARLMIKGLEKENRESRAASCVCMDAGFAEEVGRSIETAVRQQNELKNLCKIIDGQRRLINSIVQDRGDPASEVYRNFQWNSQAYATALGGMNVNSEGFDNNSERLQQESGGIRSPTSASNKNIIIRPVYPPSLSPPSSIYTQNNDVKMIANDVVMQTNEVMKPNVDVTGEINPNNISYKMSTPVEETDPPGASSSQAFCISQPSFSKGFSATDLTDGVFEREDVDINTESVVRRTSVYDRTSGDFVGLQPSTATDRSDVIDIHSIRSGEADMESSALGKADVPQK